MAAVPPLVVESCHSVWVFDTERRRFQRILRDGTTGVPPVTAWRPYHDLRFEPGSDGFVVQLDEAGTRWLRSWRHLQDRCATCGAEPSTGLTAGEALAVRVAG